MLSLILALILVWIIIGIIGFVAHGIFWLFIIACIGFVATLAFGGLKSITGRSSSPARRRR